MRLPLGYHKLRSYQKDACAEFFDQNKLIYWVGTGLGKTALALSTLYMKDVGWPVLILTRAIGRNAWVRDSKWVLGDDYLPGILRQGSKKSKDGDFQDGTFSDLDLALSEHLIVVSNYEVVQMRITELLRVPWKALILDEVHLLKGGMNPIKFARGNVPKFTRYHYVKMLACHVKDRGGFLLQQTATPMKDRPRDLWAQLDLATLDKFLTVNEVKQREFWCKANGYKPPQVFWFSREKAAGKGPFGTFWHFATKYCDAKQGQYGWVTTGASNQKELKERTSKICVQRSKQEVISELPQLTRDVQILEVKLPKSDFSKSKIENAFARSAFAKIDTSFEILEPYILEGQKVLLIVNMRSIANTLVTKLRSWIKKEKLTDVWTECITGIIPIQKRLDLLEKFNNYEKTGCFVATIGSLSEAIDLHFIDTAIVLSLPYTPGLLAQFEGRFQRLRGTPTTIYYLVAEGSIDDYAKETLLDKLETVVEISADTGTESTSLEALKAAKSDEEIQADMLSWLESKER